MSSDTGIDPRRDRLDAALEHEIAKARSRGMTEYWLGQILMVITLAASAVPAVGGIFELLTPRQLGALAAVPAGMAFVAAIFKFPAKANWYWRQAAALETIRDTLVYGSPKEYGLDTVARARTKLKEKMSEEWEREFTISWATFGSQASRSSSNP